MCEVIGAVLWWRGEGAKRLGNCFASIFVHHAPFLQRSSTRQTRASRTTRRFCTHAFQAHQLPSLTFSSCIQRHQIFSLYCVDARVQCRHDLLLSNTRRMHRCDTVLLSETSATGNPDRLHGIAMNLFWSGHLFCIYMATHPSTMFPFASLKMIERHQSAPLISPQWQRYTVCFFWSLDRDSFSPKFVQPLRHDAFNAWRADMLCNH
jgi:hypothetical protein